MFKELFSKFRKTQEPVVDEKALEEERKWQKQKEIVENYYKERAQRLADVCQQLQLSREELKEKLDITEEMINDFESYNPHSFSFSKPKTAILLYQLLKHENVNPVYLIGGTGDMFLPEEYIRYITSLDCGDDNAEVMALMTFMILSPSMRKHIFLHFRYFISLGHDIFVDDIQKSESNLEEKKG